jgi:hypothetical protein
MNFERKDVDFLVVNINDTRHIPHIRRNGPMSNLAVPMHHFTFLESQSFSMEVLKAVMRNGDVIVNPAFASAKPLTPAVVREVLKAAAPAAAEEPAPAPVVEQPVVQEAAQEPAPQPAQTEEPVQQPIDTDGDGTAGEEDKPLADVNGDGKINLMDTITETEGEISLNVLTLEQYKGYTKVELFEFLSKIADQFPAEVKKQIKKSATEKQLLEIIAENLI